MKKGAWVIHDEHLRDLPMMTSVKGDKPKEEPEPLDRPGQDYQAFGRVTAKPIRSLRIYFNASERRHYGKTTRQFQFHSIESDDEHCGLSEDKTEFSITFTTSSLPQRLTVFGRNLEEKYEALIEHKIAFIRSADDREEQLLSEDEPCVTGIKIEAVKPPKEKD